MRAWEEFLVRQEKELGKDSVNKWLRPLKLLRFDACNLYLEAPDSFKALWFEEHMRKRVQSALINNNLKPIKVHISVAAEQKVTKPKPKAAKPFPQKEFSLEFDSLDPKAQFDTFLPAQNNLLAFKLLCECAQIDSDTLKPQPSDNTPLTFNPIYLFGRSGSGKSHLMMATAEQLRKNGTRAVYVRATTFTEHVVHAIRGAQMQTFRQMYRNVDALLIDDIEIFSKKSATQEELFHTFNTLHTQGKQIILSATCPPGELKAIEPRLVSRFEWGIVIPLQPPNGEQLKQILLHKANQMAFPLHEEVIAFLLETFQSSAKVLVRALDALILRTHLNRDLQNPPQLPLPLKTAERYLADLIHEEEKSALTAGKIIRSVAEYFGIRMDDIVSKSQARESVLPRQIAMHLCREELRLPYMKIGDLFSRDHSTVMASIKQVQKGIDSKNHELISSLKGIAQKLH